MSGHSPGIVRTLFSSPGRSSHPGRHRARAGELRPRTRVHPGDLELEHRGDFPGAPGGLEFAPGRPRARRRGAPGRSQLSDHRERARPPGATAGSSTGRTRVCRESTREPSSSSTRASARRSRTGRAGARAPGNRPGDIELEGRESPAPITPPREFGELLRAPIARFLPGRARFERIRPRAGELRHRARGEPPGWKEPPPPGGAGFELEGVEGAPSSSRSYHPGASAPSAFRMARNVSAWVATRSS